jgi:uncharacterized membrane protein
MVMNLFAPDTHIDDARVVSAIAAAETRTSGEIRVVVSQRSIEDPLAEAARQFEKLGMTATAARNGVLIFVAPRSHTFAVIGDRGVHEKCGEPFWRALADAMRDRFKAGDFTAGVVLAIERAGALLAEHFPRQPDDRDELPNAVAGDA